MSVAPMKVEKAVVQEDMWNLPEVQIGMDEDWLFYLNWLSLDRWVRFSWVFFPPAGGGHSPSHVIETSCSSTIVKLWEFSTLKSNKFWKSKNFWPMWKKCVCHGYFWGNLEICSEYNVLTSFSMDSSHTVYILVAWFCITICTLFLCACKCKDLPSFLRFLMFLKKHDLLHLTLEVPHLESYEGPHCERTWLYGYKDTQQRSPAIKCAEFRCRGENVNCGLFRFNDGCNDTFDLGSSSHFYLLELSLFGQPQNYYGWMKSKLLSDIQ